MHSKLGQNSYEFARNVPYVRNRKKSARATHKAMMIYQRQEQKDALDITAAEVFFFMALESMS